MTEELKQKAIKASDKKCVKGCSKYYRYGFQDGYIAGATENGIQWHDLRKDPNDLPKVHYYELLAYRTDYKRVTHISYDTFHKEWLLHDGSSQDVIIAWCEEPQFKE